VNIENASYGQTADMETFETLVYGIADSALLHSGPQISQTLPQIVRILHFDPVDSLLHNAPD